MWINKEASPFKQLTSGAHWNASTMATAALNTAIWLVFAVQCLLHFHDGKVLSGATHLGFALTFTPFLLGSSGLQVVNAHEDPALHKAISILGLVGALSVVAALTARFVAA